MDAINEAYQTIKLIESHNEEQRVIQKINEPLLKQIKDWTERMSSAETIPDNLVSILEKVNIFLETGQGLEEARLLTKTALIQTTKEKMEELNACKH